MNLSKMLGFNKREYTKEELDIMLKKATSSLESNGISITKGGTISYPKAVEIFGEPVVNKGLHNELIIVNEPELHKIRFGSLDATLTTNPFVREGIPGKLFELGVKKYSESNNPDSIIKNARYIANCYKLEFIDDHKLTKDKVIFESAANCAKEFLLSNFKEEHPEYAKIINEAYRLDELTIIPNILEGADYSIKTANENEPILEKYSIKEIGKFLNLDYKKFPDKFYNGKPYERLSLNEPFTEDDFKGFDISSYKPEDLFSYFKKN